MQAFKWRTSLGDILYLICKGFFVLLAISWSTLVLEYVGRLFPGNSQNNF